MISALKELSVQDKDAKDLCVQKLAYFLCSFYLPNCRAPVEISRKDCQTMIDDRNGVCSSTLVILRQNGYRIDWPPVEVDCNSISPSVASPNGERPSYL